MSKAIRIVLVNHTHPADGHVSSLRMTMFASHLAARGNDVILMTAESPSRRSATPIGDLAAIIDGRTSASPLHLEITPRAAPVVTAAREGKLPFGIRQAVIGYQYLVHSGVFPDWRRGVQPYIPVIAEAFRPDVVIGTFGNTDTWSIARSLARKADCPWIADLKDNWQAFLPRGLAAPIAARYADMAHMTAYSDSHLAHACRWFAADKTVVYSGFDHLAISGNNVAAGDRISLIGSVYDDANIETLLRGMALRRDQATVLTYAGRDGARLRSVAEKIDAPVRIDDKGQLDPASVGDLLATSLCNAYIVNPSSLFQQKLLELLAAGRPVIAVPGESAEAHGIATRTGGNLIDCRTPQDVATALDEISASPGATTPADFDTYSWDAQSDKLEALMRRLVGARP